MADSNPYTHSIPITSPILYSVELSFLILSLVTNFLFGFILWRTSCLHRNLMVLLFSLILTTYAHFCARMFFLSDGLFLNFYLYYNFNITIYQFLLFLADMCAAIFSFNLVGVVLERIIATIFAHSYESSHKLTVVIALVPWVISIICVGLFILFSTRATTIHVPILSFTGAIILFDLLSWMCLLVLYKFNKTYYRKAFTLSLSEKYQVAENIRAVRMMFIYVMLTTIGNLIVSGILVLQGSYLIPKEVIFKKPSTCQPAQQENVLGDRLIINSEGAYYFKCLENQWNITYLHDVRHNNARKDRWAFITNRINPQ